MSAQLVLLLSQLITSRCSSIEFGIKTAQRDETVNDAEAMTSVDMTLYWQQYRFKCNLSPIESNTYYSCNTSNVIYVDECDTNISANPVQYGLQIDNGNSDTVHVDTIIIKQSQPQTMYTFKYFCVNLSLTQTDPFNNQISDHCSSSGIEFDIIAMQSHHNYLFTFNPNTFNISESNMISMELPAECTSISNYDYYYYDDDSYMYNEYETTNYNWDSDPYTDDDTDIYDEYDINWFDFSETNGTNRNEQLNEHEQEHELEENATETTADTTITEATETTEATTEATTEITETTEATEPILSDAPDPKTVDETIETTEHILSGALASVSEDKKHTDTVLIIIGVVLVVLAMIGIYWGVYNRHIYGLRQKLLFMEQNDTQHN